LGELFEWMPARLPEHCKVVLGVGNDIITGYAALRSSSLSQPAGENKYIYITDDVSAAPPVLHLVASAPRAEEVKVHFQPTPTKTKFTPLKTAVAPQATKACPVVK
jgi:hypothetical protein